ncbi:MAG: 6-phosphofructokinase [Clostridiales bacterium]|jgi:6-phosphofructokinase 1|nr:6-phosphofructokinase [Clostridiales bacterium]
MKKVAILTSGGDAPGMNACVRACVRYAIAKDLDVYGIERGYHGLVNNKINFMSTRSVSDIVHRGGTVLKTARCPEFREVSVQEQAAETLQAYGIDSLIVIGGDGSFRGAKDLSDNCGINVVGIPATIDNDLAYTDFTIGFDTAVNTVLDAINNLRDTMGSHDRVSMLEVMGRKCGDIALYASLAGGAEFCLTPEVPFDIKEISKTLIKSRKRGKTSNMIVFAEGAGDRDAICKELEQSTGLSVKTTTLGYVQRGGAPTMADRILAARMGVRAVDLLLEGKTNKAVGVKDNHIFDMDISEALAIKHNFSEELYNVMNILAR